MRWSREKGGGEEAMVWCGVVWYSMVLLLVVLVNVKLLSDEGSESIVQFLWPFSSRL